MGKLEDLEKLQKLKESGVITQEEFDMEKAKILNEDNNGSITVSNIESKKDMFEIKGEFPFVESKIQIKLLDNERIIVQEEITTLTGVGSTAVNGLITLTNKRILFNKKTTAKSYLATGLLGVALGAGNKDVSINFKQIHSIEAKKIRMNAGGMEVVTNDGYSHRFIFNNKQIAIRDMIIELINGVIGLK